MGSSSVALDQKTYGTSSSKTHSHCVNSEDFKRYFNENMEALGLPVPDSLFTSFAATLANARMMLGAANVGGAGATMGELAFATTVTEVLTVVAGLSAAGYVGAVVGSLFVASGRYAACGTSIADAISFIEENNLPLKTPRVFFANNPEILNASMPNRSAYAKRYNLEK